MSPYKDPEKQRKAVKKNMRRYRLRKNPFAEYTHLWDVCREHPEFEIWTNPDEPTVAFVTPNNKDLIIRVSKKIGFSPRYLNRFKVSLIAKAEKKPSFEEIKRMIENKRREGDKE
jgi:hypothetical protein